MPYYAVQPLSAATECYLVEALYWAAVQRFPYVDYDLDGKPWRHGEAWLSEDPWDACRSRYGDLEDHECARIGLQPHWKIAGLAHDRLRREMGLTKKAFNRRLEAISAKDAGCSKGAWHNFLTQLFEAEKQALDEHLTSQEVVLERAANALLEGLKAGNIRASGHPWPKGENFDSARPEPEHALETLNYANPREPIPAEHWGMGQTNWDFNRLDRSWVVYRMILVDTDDLFKAMPPCVDTTIRATDLDQDEFVVQISKDLRLPLRSRGAGGRPRKPEGDFYIEVIRRLIDGEFNFQKQEAEVAYFVEWSQRTHTEQLSSTWLKRRLRKVFELKTLKDQNS